MNPATPDLSFIMLLRNNNKMADALEEIEKLELPCYMEPEGGEVCQDNDPDGLCDACKVRKILREV